MDLPQVMSSTRVDGIPALLAEPHPNQAGEWAILFHAAHQSKEHMGRSAFAAQLCKHGLGVLIPDLPMHGERCTDVTYNRDVHRLRVAGTMARELPGLLDAVGARSAITIGGSLGGLCALAGPRTSERVRTVVAYMTRVAWRSFPSTGYDEDRRTVLELDPVTSPDAFVGCNVLLVFGEEDRWASPRQELVELEPIRTAIARGGGKLTITIIPRTGHRLPPTYESKLAAWVTTHLVC
jgi:hypothetical protein